MMTIVFAAEAEAEAAEGKAAKPNGSPAKGRERGTKKVSMLDLIHASNLTSILNTIQLN
jgi:hypothetical protein